MSLTVRVNGQPRAITGAAVRVNGALRTVTGGGVRVNGFVQPFLEPATGVTLEVTTNVPSNITETSARFTGSLSFLAGTDSAEVWFDYRESGATTWTETPHQVRSTTGSFAEDVTGLTAGTTYEVRARASADAGATTATGQTQTFTTTTAAENRTLIDDFSGGTFTTWGYNEGNWSIVADSKAGNGYAAHRAVSGFPLLADRDDFSTYPDTGNYLVWTFIEDGTANFNTFFRNADAANPFSAAAAEVAYSNGAMHIRRRDTTGAITTSASTTVTLPTGVYLAGVVHLDATDNLHFTIYDRFGNEVGSVSGYVGAGDVAYDPLAGQYWGFNPNTADATHRIGDVAIYTNQPTRDEIWQDWPARPQGESALWNITEGSGTTLREAGDATMDATASGGSWVSDPFATGGVAYNFGGVGGALVSDNPSVTLDNAGTVLVELYPHAWTQWSTILAKGRSVATSTDAEYSFYTDGSGQVRFRIQDASGSNAYATSNALSTGRWHRLAGRYDGSSVSVWSNGSQDGAQTGIVSGLVNNTTHPLSFGYDAHRNNYRANVSIGRVSVWEEALTDAELAELTYVSPEAGGGDTTADVTIDHEAAYDTSQPWNGAGYSNSADANELTRPYHIYDHRGGTVRLTRSAPVTPVSGSTVLEHTLGTDSKTANCQFEFPHHGYTLPKETFWRMYVHPNGFTFNESGATCRYAWGAIRPGPGSSGGTGTTNTTDGTNGWGIALSWGRRLDTPGNHPNAYGARAYIYHMDKTMASGDNFICGTDPGEWIQMNQWNKLEFYHKLNTYQNGTANYDGVFRLWVNDTEVKWHDASGNPRDNTRMRWAAQDGQENTRPGMLQYTLGSSSNEDIYYDDFSIWFDNNIPDQYRYP